MVRQLKYNPTREWSIDLVFFVNGLPVSTWELKSDFTQSVEHAVRQYKEDRSPKAPQGGAEPLLAFRRGALVHFALSTTRAMMCTHLKGESSLFLPFNRGDDRRAGNSASDDPNRYPVAYLWEEIFRKDNLLTLIHRFFLFESKWEEDANGKRNRSETMFFPRYHQWQAVTKLDAAVRDEGVGHRYLLEHSAGSGKTNTIAWLCHSLIRKRHAAQLPPVRDAAGDRGGVHPRRADQLPGVRRGVPAGGRRGRRLGGCGGGGGEGGEPARSAATCGCTRTTSPRR